MLTYFKRLKDYQLYINKVFEYLKVKDLRLKLKKYKFYKKNIDFLEFIIKRYRIYIDLVKLQAIREQKELTNVKEV